MITDLHGVGAKTAVKLQSFGIQSIAQLLRSTNHAAIPGLSKLQAKAQQSVVPPTTVESHSWYQCRTHILRPGNRIVRCTVHEIIIKHSRVLISCTFRENGTFKRKWVTPFALLVVEQIWMQLDAVSDSESDGDNGESLMSLKLPRLTLTDRSKLESIAICDKTTISSLVKEVQSLLYLNDIQRIGTRLL